MQNLGSEINDRDSITVDRVELRSDGFEYLCQLLTANRSLLREISHRIYSLQLNWISTTALLCDRKVCDKLKLKSRLTVVPALAVRKIKSDGRRRGGEGAA